MPLRRVLSMGLAALAGAAPVAADSGDRATYDLYLSGIKAGELRVSATEEGGTYRATSKLEAAGVVGTFVRYAFDGEATGRVVSNGALEPRRFVATSRSPRADRRTLIEFTDGTPTRVSVEPPRSSSPDPAGQGGTLDPVSAGFALLRDGPPERICNSRVDMFDGSRRSRILIGSPEPRDGGFVCNGTFARIEGEAHSAGDSDRYPFRLLLRRNGNGEARVERIETNTRFGRAVVERRG